MPFVQSAFSSASPAAPVATPGDTLYELSNPGTQLLGATVAVAAGLSVAAYAWEIVEEPIGSTAAFDDASLQAPTITTSHRGPHALQVRGQDSSGTWSEWAALTVDVAALPAAPVIVVTAAAGVEVIAAGGTVVLTAASTLAPGATVASVAWTCTRYDAAGAATPANARLSTLVATPSTLTAEATANGYAYDCDVTVTDSNGRTGVGSIKIRTSAIAAPSGTLGADETVTTLAAFPVVKAGAAGVSGADTYAITAIEVAAPDTSGYVPGGALTSSVDIAAMFTPDGPCTVTMTVAATGPGGTREFDRVVTVDLTAPVAAIAAVTPQMNLARATLDSSTSSGTAPLTRLWTLTERSAEGGAVNVVTLLSSTSAEAPTFDPRRLDADYLALLTLTDAYGRVSVASTVAHVGAPAWGVVAPFPTIGTAT